MLARNWIITLYKFVNGSQLPKEIRSSESGPKGADFRKKNTHKGCTKLTGLYDKRLNKKLLKISPIQAAVHANESVFLIFLFRGGAIRSFP
jgi:hypothetical protein